ncbi:hypothetical protein [Sphingobacterium kitahiroshimense]|uniref:Restriction endonuclease type IV Mrr domain-containing protein n=1 Tax=Sphingobacterium kitahiroshimense TaxID=470446 RepID=A0ABV0BWB6_9SPHI
MSSTFQNIQIPAPFQNDMLFEDFTKHYFNELHKTTSYSLFGRNGQNQAGIDVISFDKKVAIQCKLRVINNQNDKTIKRNLIIELKKDFKSFLIYIKENNLPFNKYIFASTYKDDVDIITECFKLSQEHGVSVEYCVILP